MRPALWFLLPALASQGAPSRSPSAREVGREALRAVETGGVPVAETRWREALRRDAGDRAALLGLATLARLTYKARAGDSLVAALRRGARAPEAYGMRAALATGIAFRERALSDSAARWLDLAAREAVALHDSAAAVVALLEQARAESALQHHARADSLRAFGMGLVPRQDREIEAYARCARLSRRVGRGDEATARDADAAAAYADSAGVRRTANWCRAIAAEERAIAGDFSAIWRDFQVVAATADSLNDTFRAADAYLMRGSQLISYGAFSEVTADLERSIARARSVGNLVTEGWSAMNLAQAYYAFGDPASAREWALRAIPALLATGRRSDAGVAYSLRGDIAVAQGAYSQAETWFDSAARVVEAAGYRAGSAHVAELRAHLAMRLGDWPRAEELLRFAWRESEGSQGTNKPLIDYLLGTVALRRGRLQEAERYYARAAPGAVEEGNLLYALDARRAELLLLRGDVAGAERTLARAGAALEAWRGRLTQRDLRANAFQASPDEADPDLGVATIIAAMVREGRSPQALALSEEQRGRDLLDRMLRAKAASGAATLGDTAVTALPHTPDAGRVQRAMGDSTALLEYVVGEGGEPTTVFVVTRDRVRGYRLTPVDSLKPAIDRFRAILESSGNPKPLGSQLGAALLGGVVSTLPVQVSHLIIIPDGALHRIPWDAVVLDDGRYLFERVAVSVAPSASIVAELRERPHRQDPAALLAFGDPVYAQGSAVAAPGDSGLAIDRPGGRGGLPRLRASSAEVRKVAAYAPGSRVLEREAASEAQLKLEPLARYQVIHFATHALVDETSPSHTALALSAGMGEDGFVSPGEMSGLTLAAHLVVLSACRTATGRLVRGEGMLGLSAPLLAAGARSVLATQWPVGDRATVPFVERFYDGLARGQSVGVALRRARLEALQAGAPAAEWAAFSLIGDPTVPVALVAPAEAPARGETMQWLVVVVLAGAVLAGGTILVRRRGTTGTG